MSFKISSDKECIIVSREHGFFSNMYSVVGAIDWCEKNNKIPTIQFDSGIYYEKECGDNWWENYFELEPHLKRANQPTVNREEYSAFASEMAMSLISDRYRTAQLIQKYITIKPNVAKIIENFWIRHTAPFTIGLHVRGTDKFNEVPPVDIKEVIDIIKRITKARDNSNWKLFIATDEQRLFEIIADNFCDNVIYQHTVRSACEQAVHTEESRNEFSKKVNNYGYKIGLEALTHMILLSGCDVLVGCQSNLSYFAAAWNPAIPWVNLSPSSLVINSTVHADLVAKEAVIQDLIKENKRLLEMSSGALKKSESHKSYNSFSGILSVLMSKYWKVKNKNQQTVC
jgi:hypothetical protein